MNMLTPQLFVNNNNEKIHQYAIKQNNLLKKIRINPIKTNSHANHSVVLRL